MNLLNKPLTLLEINDLLEEKLRCDNNRNRIIGDLDLSYEEYCLLSLKSKGIQCYTNDFEILENYRVVVIVSWVFTLRYAPIEKVKVDKIKRIFTNLQQHIVRKTIDTIAETFEELGMNTYGLDIYTLDGLFTLIGLHAGVPESICDKLFSILDESTNYKDMNSVEHQLLTEMDSRMVLINQYIGDRMARKQIIEIRDLFMDCKLNNMTLNELNSKYPNTSCTLLENCIHWCRENALFEKDKKMHIISK